MSELKRCPFCGDEVEIFATGLYHWKYAIHHKSKTECILDANAFALPYEEEDAVRMWNTRADHKTENCSEKPNNCGHITEDGVTCAKYPACDDCPDNPLNKVKGSERLVKGSRQTDCDTCKYAQIADEHCEFCGEAYIDNYEPQTESYYTDATHFGKAKGESTTTNTADTPQTEQMKTADYCDICKQDMCKDCIADATNPYCVPSHYEINYEPKDEPTTQTETQNSNLTFEKRTMLDCYNCKRYKSDDACVECRYEPKADTPQTEDEIVLDPSFAELSDEQFVKAMKLIEPQTDCGWK